MNWKTCFLPLLLAAVMLGSVTAFADGEPAAPPAVQNEAQTALAAGEPITEGNLTYRVNDDGQTVTLTNGSSVTGSITIPAAVEHGGTSYPVTSIGDNAFQYCRQLVSVTFSGSIDCIGYSAFYDCDGLKTVTFSGNIDSIGVEAFSHCNDLENVTFPGNVGNIEDLAFVNCTALENVTFSGNVGNIGSDAFRNCDGLKTVTFYGNVGSIESGAFYDCDDLKNVTFYGNVGSIGDYAFFSCYQLNTVTFYGNVGSIGDSAFVDAALKTVTFSGDVTSIGYGAFWSCSVLESVTFSGNVGSIGDYAFQYCTELTTIYVPASMSEETVQIIRDALTGSGLPDVQIVQPEQPSDPSTDPSTPSAPSTGTTGSASTAVQQLEAAERPDPMDVEANERYNFWMDVKSDLRAAGDGRTVRVYVPADYTNMPASVMETIRTLGKEITIDLRWNGQRLIITPQTALQRPARKAFWTFDALCEVYAR